MDVRDGERASERLHAFLTVVSLQRSPDPSLDGCLTTTSNAAAIGQLCFSLHSMVRENRCSKERTRVLERHSDFID